MGPAFSIGLERDQVMGPAVFMGLGQDLVMEPAVFMGLGLNLQFSWDWDWTRLGNKQNLVKTECRLTTKSEK